MAKGNDGNYLQHCVEIEAAVRLSQADRRGRLHVALTHGMAPFEKLEEAKANKGLLHGALCEAAGEPRCNEREIVRAYRRSWASQAYRPDIANLFDELKSEKHYPNSAELLRAIIGRDQLSDGITEKMQPGIRRSRRPGPVRKSRLPGHHGASNWARTARWAAPNILMCRGCFRWIR